MNTKTLRRITIAATFVLTSHGLAEEPKVVSKNALVGVLEKKPSLTRSISAAPKPSIAIQSILFKSGSTEVEGAKSYEQIKEIGEALSDPRLKDAVVEVQGHTDNVGTDESNMKLSEQRAAKIVEILTHLYKVPTANLKAVGKGESTPISGSRDQQTDEQRKANRRVVIERQK